MIIMGKDRRRYLRVGLELEVSLEASGIRWQGKTLDLSPYGVKVALPPHPVTLPPGTSVELRLALSGGDSPLSLTASVVRMDPDGIALNFLNQGALPFARLKDLVDSRPLKDRRRAPRADAELDISLDAEMPRCWQGKYTTINLSTIGVKVAWPATGGQPSWGTGVQLCVAEPGGQRLLSLKGLVWRREPQSVAFLFIELRPEQRERLQTLVDSLRGAAFASFG
jgi:hypothetical protein